MRALKTTQIWPTMGLEIVGFRAVRSMDAMLEVEAEALTQGYEGLILRLPNAHYKPGRSTLREGGMIKVKRTLDAEARVVGMVELEHNENAAERNELGLTRRSSHQEGKFGANVLGALIVELPSGVRFNIGTGFSAAERQIIWTRRHECLDRVVKFRYFGHGEHERPRHPRFLSWRHEDDLS
jgi:DNA ligase-1